MMMASEAETTFEPRSRLAMMQQQISRAASRLRSFSDSCHWPDNSESSGCIVLRRSSPLAYLNDEVVEFSCTYLNPSDLIKLSRCCRRLNQVALRNRVWRKICLAQWGFQLPSLNGIHPFLEPNFVEIYPLIEHYPVGFDVEYPDKNLIYINEILNRVYSCQSNIVLAIEYLGDVGTGNRCVRTNLPFPSSYIWERHSPAAHSTRGGATSGSLSMMYRLLRVVHGNPAQPGAASAALSLVGATASGAAVHTIATTPLPFSVPTTLESGEINFEPRLISYFEIEISPPSGKKRRNEAPDCIAIGLSDKFFPLEGKMPGWDLCSYGYHSDDGGAFHNAGSMLFRYGPTFGCGDIVGCGLDFSHGRGVSADIFFTLNGVYLGIAFSNVHASSLYPTVGIDSNSSIRINLGHQTPFRFDLISHERERWASALTRHHDESLAAEASWAARQNKAAAICPFLIGAAALPALAMARAESF